MNKAVRELVILGGGTAGWLTAAIVASQHCSWSESGLKVTVVDSDKIPTIGVGEGTWPTMRDTLSSVGISEEAFISCCDASFKQGSCFINWCEDSKTEHYYHPFVAPHGFGKTDLVHHWQQNRHASFAHTLSYQPHLCDNFKAPKQLQTPAYAAVANYGYHLDAAKFAQLLKNHCQEKLGVKHINDQVVKVVEDKQGYISALLTQNSGQLEADLFVDCSGQHAKLIGEHYQIPLKPVEDILFNNRAIAVQAPYPQDNNKIASCTLATAHDTGWIWDIGLPHRRGVGCVYSDKFCTTEIAKAQLESYLKKQLSEDSVSQLSFRELAFEPGYRAKFWHNNCVAIGMSAGFIEPLEASALALVELSAKMLAKELPANRDIMSQTERRFNRRFEYRWQRIIAFLKLHYVLSNRSSDYWQAHRNADSIPEHLQELLALWQYQEPSYNDFTEIEEIFPAASYQYILYGMGFKTENRPCERAYNNPSLATHLVQENQQLIDKYLAGLPDNNTLLAQINQLYRQQRSGLKYPEVS